MHDPLLALRRRLFRARMRSAPAQPSSARNADDEVDHRSSELLDERLGAEARRGPLGEFDYLYDVLERLEARRQAGEIGADEYEAEKGRLLGG